MEKRLSAAPRHKESDAGQTSQRSKKKKKGKKKVARRFKIEHEELYTDKDRAAAVNMGSRDIKLSLKQKRRYFQDLQ